MAITKLISTRQSFLTKLIEFQDLIESCYKHPSIGESENEAGPSQSLPIQDAEGRLSVRFPNFFSKL